MSEIRYWFPKPYADFVARLRVPCGFLLLIAFAWLAEPTELSLAVGLPVGALGLLLRGWAAGHLAKNERLSMSGPYAFIRNPLYAGTLVAAAGVVIASRNFFLMLIFTVVFLLVYLPVIELEEQHLRNIFPEYTAYAERIHRLLPLSHLKGGGNGFSWKLYNKNEEYKALIGFLLAVAWLVMKWKLERPAVFFLRVA
jgi:protein-S-isoprenylcysteine O-methyltransferase Ste14